MFGFVYVVVLLLRTRIFSNTCEILGRVFAIIMTALSFLELLRKCFSFNRASRSHAETDSCAFLGPDRIEKVTQKRHISAQKLAQNWLKTRHFCLCRCPRDPEVARRGLSGRLESFRGAFWGTLGRLSAPNRDQNGAKGCYFGFCGCHGVPGVA